MIDEGVHTVSVKIYQHIIIRALSERRVNLTYTYEGFIEDEGAIARSLKGCRHRDGAVDSVLYASRAVTIQLWTSW